MSVDLKALTEALKRSGGIIAAVVSSDIEPFRVVEAAARAVIEAPTIRRCSQHINPKYCVNSCDRPLAALVPVSEEKPQ